MLNNPEDPYLELESEELFLSVKIVMLQNSRVSF